MKNMDQELRPFQERIADYEKVFNEVRKKNPDVEFTTDDSSIKIINKEGEIIGSLYGFLQEDGSLLIMGVDVKESERRKGLAKMMFAKFLMKHPEVNVITGALGSEAEIDFWKDVKAGKSFEDAIRNTPAYKLRSAFGFTELQEIPEPGTPRNAVISITSSRE